MSVWESLTPRWQRFKRNFVRYCIVSAVAVHVIGGYMTYRVLEPILHRPHAKVADVVTMAFKKASVAESNVAEPKIVTHRPTTPVCYGDNWAQQFESILHDAGATPLAKCQPKIPQVRVLYDGPHEPGECHLMRVFLQITRPTKDPLIVPDVIDRANQGKELCWDKRDTEEQRDLKVAKYLVDLREVNRTLLRDRMREVLQKL